MSNSEKIRNTEEGSSLPDSKSVYRVTGLEQGGEQPTVKSARAWSKLPTWAGAPKRLGAILGRGHSLRTNTGTEDTQGLNIGLLYDQTFWTMNLDANGPHSSRN